MTEELTYKKEAAAGYDRAFARVTTQFVPFLLQAAHIAPGMHVLDIAAGTGILATANVRFASKANICNAKWQVCFTPESGACAAHSACPRPKADIGC